MDDIFRIHFHFHFLLDIFHCAFPISIFWVALDFPGLAAASFLWWQLLSDPPILFLFLVDFPSPHPASALQGPFPVPAFPVRFPPLMAPSCLICRRGTVGGTYEAMTYVLDRNLHRRTVLRPSVRQMDHTTPTLHSCIFATEYGVCTYMQSFDRVLVQYFVTRPCKSTHKWVLRSYVIYLETPDMTSM